MVSFAVLEQSEKASSYACHKDILVCNSYAFKVRTIFIQ